MRIANRYVFILFLLGLFYANRINSQECYKDTVYLVFDISKKTDRDIYYITYSEGAYIRYIDEKDPKNIIFERRHKYGSSIFDTFIIDRKKHTPRKVSKKDIDGLNIMDYDDIEAELNKRKKYEEPEAVFPNFGIIEVSGQSAIIYNPVRWKRIMHIE